MKKALFHISRGGRFNNAGHKTCKGLVGGFDPEYYGINIYHDDEPTDESEVTLSNGEVVCTYGELKSDSGKFNIDNDYDTYVWCPIDELDEDEIKIVVRDLRAYEYEDEFKEAGVEYHFD